MQFKLLLLDQKGVYIAFQNQTCLIIVAEQFYTTTPGVKDLGECETKKNVTLASYDSHPVFQAIILPE